MSSFFIFNSFYTKNFSHLFLPIILIYEDVVETYGKLYKNEDL